MSRIAVLGAGVVGRAAAWDLVRRGHEVVVGDADPAAAERVGAEIGAATGNQVDASSESQAGRFFAGADLVVSAVPFRFGEVLARIALEAGAHYLDFGGNPSVVERQLRLHHKAARAGLAVIPDCGLAPGLANVLVVADAEALGPGPIDRIGLRVGALPAEPVGPLGYQLCFSPEGLINEYAEPCEVVRDGRFTTVDPLSEIEPVEWDRWGPLEAFHTAGGSSSLARDWEGRVGDLDYKTLRYPGHAAVFGALRDLGLFSETPIRIGEAEISPRRVLIDALERHLPRGGDDVVLLRTFATARREGATVTRGHQMVDRADDRFSALARTTAFPASALAHMLVAGTLTTAGATTMEKAVPAGRLLAELVPLGITIEPLPAAP